jgi:hypothetical protein
MPAWRSTDGGALYQPAARGRARVREQRRGVVPPLTTAPRDTQPVQRRSRSNRGACLTVRLYWVVCHVLVPSRDGTPGPDWRPPVMIGRERHVLRVPVAAAVLCLIAPLAAAQSLGDAARRQARKRATEAPKSGTAATKSYSESDLVSGRDPSTLTPPPSGEDDPRPAEAARSPEAADALLRAQLDREESNRKERDRSWRDRCQAARARLESAQREYDAACGPGKVLTGG